VLHFLKSIIGFWFKAIHRQLILAFVLSTALLMLVFAHSLIRHEAGFLESRSVEQATALAHTLAVSSASWALADDVVGLQEVVLSVGNLLHLRYVLEHAPERREEIHHYLDRAEQLFGHPADGGNAGLQEALLITMGGGKKNIDRGAQLAMALNKKQANEYMHRLEVAGLGDRRYRMNPALAMALDPPKA